MIDVLLKHAGASGFNVNSHTKSELNENLQHLTRKHLKPKCDGQGSHE